MDALLVRMSTEAAPSRTGRVVFLINNYSAVYNTATERGVHPDDAMPFETALKTQVRGRVFVMRAMPFKTALKTQVRGHLTRVCAVDACTCC